MRTVVGSQLKVVHHRQKRKIYNLVLGVNISQQKILLAHQTHRICGCKGIMPVTCKKRNGQIDQLRRTHVPNIEVAWAEKENRLNQMKETHVCHPVCIPQGRQNVWMYS